MQNANINTTKNTECDTALAYYY